MPSPDPLLRRSADRPLAATVASLVLIAATSLVAAPALAQKAALTQNVDEPGRTPFALQQNNSTLNPYFATFTVPANQRYVIEKYTASCDVFATTAMGDASIQATSGGNVMVISAEGHLVQANGFNSGSAVNYYRATGDGPLYADPGSTFTMFASTRAGTGYSYMRNCSFYVTGHAINNP